MVSISIFGFFRNIEEKRRGNTKDYLALKLQIIRFFQVLEGFYLAEVRKLFARVSLLTRQFPVLLCFKTVVFLKKTENSKTLKKNRKFKKNQKNEKNAKNQKNPKKSKNGKNPKKPKFFKKPYF